MRINRNLIAAIGLVTIAASIPPVTADAQTTTHDGFAITGAMKCGTTERVTLRYTPQTAMVDNDPQRSRYAKWKIAFANPGTYTIRITNNNNFGVRLSTWPSGNMKQTTFHELKWPTQNPPGQFNWGQTVTIPEMHIGVAHVYPVRNSGNHANNFTIGLIHPDCSEVKRMTTSRTSNIKKLKMMMTQKEFALLADDEDLNIGDDLVEIEEDGNTGSAGYDQAEASKFCREQYSDNRRPVPTGDGGYVCVVVVFSCPEGGCTPPPSVPLPSGSPGQIPLPTAVLGQDPG